MNIFNVDITSWQSGKKQKFNLRTKNKDGKKYYINNFDNCFIKLQPN